MIWRNYFDKLSRYFWFSKRELLNFVITVLVLGFVVSFNQWGDAGFDAAVGFRNLFIAFLFVAIALFVHHAGQRLWGLYNGYRVENKLWWYGLLASLIFAVLSNGAIKFLGASSTWIHQLERHRLGKFRFGPNMSDFASVCLAGPIANIFFAGLTMTLSWAGFFPADLAYELFTFNMVFAAWNLIPIPPLDGSRIMYFSRLAYVFFAATIGSYAVMVYLLGVYSYIIAILIGILAWFIYLVAVERKL